MTGGAGDQSTRKKHWWNPTLFGGGEPPEPLEGEAAWQARLELERRNATPFLPQLLAAMSPFFLIFLLPLLLITKANQFGGAGGVRTIAPLLPTLLLKLLVPAALVVVVVIAAPLVDRWLRRRLWSQPVSKTAEQLRAGEMKNFWMRHSWMIAAPLVFLLIGVLLRDSRAALIGAGFGFIIVGSHILGHARFRRVGRDLCCVSCGYPVPEDKPAWDVCSECGEDLNRPFGVVLGARSPSRRLMVIGVVLALAGVAVLVGPMVLG